jgi:hypothetical protein
MPKTNATLMRLLAKAAAASEPVPTCPTMSVSTNPINIWPTWPAIIGQASARVLESSVLKRRGSGIDRSPNQDFGVWQVIEASRYGEIAEYGAVKSATTWRGAARGSPRRVRRLLALPAAPLQVLRTAAESVPRLLLSSADSIFRE